MGSVLYGGRGLTLTEGSGGRVRDSLGREYLDWFTGHGALLFGHRHPRLVAVLEEAAEGLWGVGAGFRHPAREACEERLAALLPRGRVLWANSGAEALEGALKLALLLRPGRPRLLAARRAFHGRTLGALGLTFNPKYREPFRAFLPPVEHRGAEELPAAVGPDVAAVFLEPLQGEGGVHPLDPELGRELTRACRASGALLVADEVQSGMGRCGALLASPLMGLEPDAVCLAKGLAGGLPAGALVWRGDLGDFAPHSHGSTCAGNPVVCRVALEAFRLLDEGLPQRGAALGEAFRGRLRGLGHPAIREVRGVGLLTGVEVAVPALGVVKALQDRGVLALAAGPRVVRFLPSFAATEEEGDRVADRFAQVLEARS